MVHLFFSNTKGTVQWLACWLLIPTLQAFVMRSFVMATPLTMCVDVLVQAIVLALLSTLLWNVTRFSNFQHFPQLQKNINFVAIGLLSVALLLLLNYGFMAILFDPESVDFVRNTLPIRLLTALLLYIILMLYFEKSVLEQINMAVENAVENQQLNDENNAKANGHDNEPKEVLERIALKNGNKLQVILVADILYLQAEGDYVQIVTHDGKYLKEQTMKYFEENLPSNIFVRVHRSHIVNMQALSRIELHEKQSQQIMLKNGHKIKISQAGYKMLRNKLNL